MNYLLTALLLGVVSMIIVFVSGLTSGVVRLTTLALRAVFAFSMTSAATYFVMMLYDYYEEIKMKKLQKETEAIIAEETPAENIETAETAEEQSPQSETVFQPINANDLPNVGK